MNEIPNFGTYHYAVKKSISLTNATTIPAGSNITLRANDFIELKPGFEVGIGRSLYLDVSPCDFDCEEYFTDKTITSNTTVKGCDILNVKDVDIFNSANVAFTADEEVIIKPGFRAEAGINVKISINP